VQLVSLGIIGISLVSKWLGGVRTGPKAPVFSAVRREIEAQANAMAAVNPERCKAVEGQELLYRRDWSALC
jgi:hypothetical protein